jgi:hypothetical protein
MLTRIVPTSSKSALYPSYISSPPSINRYYADPVLANAAGHGLLADTLIAYIQSQVCVAWSAARGSGAALPLYYTLGVPAGTPPKDATGLFGGKGPRKGAAGAAGAAPAGAPAPADADAPRPRAASGHNPFGLLVPASRIGSQPEDMSSRTHEEVTPACVSANDLVNPLPLSIFYGSGWNAYHPPQTTIPVITSASHYWYSTLPTSRFRVPLSVGAGDIGIYYVREPRAVLGSEGPSAVDCWVDDNYQGRATVDNEGDTDEEVAV